MTTESRYRDAGMRPPRELPEPHLPTGDRTLESTCTLAADAASAVPHDIATTTTTTTTTTTEE